MKKIWIWPLLIGLLIFNVFVKNLYSQDGVHSTIDSLNKKQLNWYNMSPSSDKIQGAEVDRAYNELLVNKTPKKKIVVAIIDSGVDINHPDLQGKIWVNPKEIPGNGIDDDSNGYIDDIHGWGFLGNSNGENIVEENIEQTRIFRDLDPVYCNVMSAEGLSEKQQKEYSLYLQCKKTHTEELSKYQQTAKNLESFEKSLLTAEGIIKKHLNKQFYTVDDLKGIKSGDSRTNSAKSYLLNLYRSGFTHEEFKSYRKHNSLYVEKHYNTKFNPRSIVGDNPNDINDKTYGNADVKGPRPDHGTPVSGIIAATRNNGIGINGIADNVALMILRAVPDGDERDKDIALAIRYAVDNGANIINMSFGKDFSPQKEYVDEALKYAEANNVLLVHAAGNKAEDIDSIERYPTNRLNDGSKVNSWISVGANAVKLDKKLCGIFSNYGQQNVDLFAPGVDVISLAPENKYTQTSGTSFSGPVVTGVAALVWSYYPELSAVELKDILMSSCTVYANKKVYYPNIKTPKRSKTKFSSLSQTGGLVNAYNALKVAEKRVQEKM